MDYSSKVDKGFCATFQIVFAILHQAMQSVGGAKCYIQKRTGTASDQKLVPGRPGNEARGIHALPLLYLSSIRVPYTLNLLTREKLHE